MGQNFPSMRDFAPGDSNQFRISSTSTGVGTPSYPSAYLVGVKEG